MKRLGVGLASAILTVAFLALWTGTRSSSAAEPATRAPTEEGRSAPAARDSRPAIARAGLPESLPPVPEGAPATVLRALAPDGRGCARAQFFERVDGVLRSLGQADEDGRLALAESPADFAELVAAAPGLAAEGVRPAPPLPEEVVIQLREPAALRGVLRAVDGGALSEGALVVAIPRGLLLTSTQRTPSSLLEDPEVLVASCSADGSFVASPANPIAAYQLIAAAPGWLAPEAPPEVVVGEEPVEIELHPAYGLALELLAPDGGPARPTFTSGARGGVSMRSRPVDLRVFSGHPLARWLAGTPLELLDPDPSTQVVIGTAPTITPAAGPLHVSTHPMGRAPYQRTLSLPRLEDGGLKTTQLLLEDAGTALTHLDVAFDVPDDARSVIVGPWAKLALGPTTGLDTVFVFGQDELPLLRAAPVEPGHYRVRLEVRPYLFQRMVDVQVGADGARLAFDASDAARLEVDVRTAAGEPYLGELTLLVASPQNEPSAGFVPPGTAPLGALDFARGPYVLGPLDPGTRFVCVPVGGPADFRWERADLESGERARITLQLP